MATIKYESACVPIAFKSLKQLKDENQSKFLAGRIRFVASKLREEIVKSYPGQVHDQRMGDFHIELSRISNKYAKPDVSQRVQDLIGLRIDMTQIEFWGRAIVVVLPSTDDRTKYWEYHPHKLHITLAFLDENAPKWFTPHMQKVLINKLQKIALKWYR